MSTFVPKDLFKIKLTIYMQYLLSDKIIAKTAPPMAVSSVAKVKQTLTVTPLPPRTITLRRVRRDMSCMPLGNQMQVNGGGYNLALFPN